jgi:RNA 3'-terminal phosphate cyclase (ATP)
MVEIDGAMGEGGGQIVRTALSLSLTAQQPIRLTNIRANRSRPGLRPQHVTAVRAAAAIGEAAVSEVREGAQTLTFEPSTVVPGTYHFDVGTAGSAVLVLQTVLLPLLTAQRSSRITVTGGTHNKFAPPFDFFATTVLPVVERMGPTLHATLDRHGFYPKGGGRCTVEVQPVAELEPLTLTERGAPRPPRIRAIVANLPRHIADREIATLREALSVEIGETRIETPSSLSAGNALLLELPFRNVTEVVSGIGEKGRPAEQVAIGVAEDAEAYLEGDAPVGPHLADQLLLPLAVGGGEFCTTTLTAHTHTNAAVIERIFGDCFSVTEGESGWLVSVSPGS